MLRVLDADEVGGRIGYDSAGTPGFSLRDSVLNLPTDIHSLFVNKHCSFSPIVCPLCELLVRLCQERLVKRGVRCS